MNSKIIAFILLFLIRLGISSIIAMKAAKELFYKTPLKVVVGATVNREKFGNKILRCYQENHYSVVPISKKEAVIEGIDAVADITTLNSRIQQGIEKRITNIGEIGCSIVTPPGVTRQILEEGYTAGVRNFYLQPGTYDESVNKYIEESLKSANVIKGKTFCYFT